MKKSVKILIIVLCLIIVLLVAFIVVDKFISFNKNENQNAVENNIVAEGNNNSESNIIENTTNEIKQENPNANSNEKNAVTNFTNNTTENIKSSNDKIVTPSKKEFSEEDLTIETFRLGESAKAVDAVYGLENANMSSYDNRESTGEYGYIIDFKSLGLKIYNGYYAGDEEDVDGTMTRIEIYGDSKLETARGIKIGSTKEEILNAYPSNSILKSDMIDENKTIIVGYPGSEPVYGSEKGNIYYYLENGKVSNILLAYAIAE